MVLKELTQEAQRQVDRGPETVMSDIYERYPIIERAASNFREFSEPSFLGGVQKAMQKILQNDKGLTTTASKGSQVFLSSSVHLTFCPSPRLKQRRCAGNGIDTY